MAGFGPGDDMEEMHEINVTPFIDVMLVLLIVFMVAAPLSTVDVPVDLPGSAAPVQQRPQDPVWLSLRADLTLTLGNGPIDRAALQAALDLQTGGNRDTRIHLRADQKVVYAEVMGVLDALRRAGYLSVALVGLEAGKP